MGNSPGSQQTQLKQRQLKLEEQVKRDQMLINDACCRILAELETAICEQYPTLPFQKCYQSYLAALDLPVRKRLLNTETYIQSLSVLMEPMPEAAKFGLEPLKLLKVHDQYMAQLDYAYANIPESDSITRGMLYHVIHGYTREKMGPIADHLSHQLVPEHEREEILGNAAKDQKMVSQMMKETQRLSKQIAKETESRLDRPVYPGELPTPLVPTHKPPRGNSNSRGHR